MERVAQRRVGAELEQRLDCLSLSGLRGEVKRGDTLAVVGSAEASALVRIGAELDELPDRRHAPVARRPGERRPSIGIGADVAPELDEQLDRAEAFAACERVIVSAGGSAYFDRVADVLGGDWQLDKPVDVVIRAGGYITHDIGLYERSSPLVRDLRPAFEVWGVVLSRPEPELVLVGLGKRDVSHDVDLPLPQLAYDRNGLRDVAGLTVTALNDQHAYVRIPTRETLKVGDLLGCGISHPCTAFDKWRLIPVVDDHYTVVDAIATFF